MSLQRSLNLEYDELIIGADFDALYYSYINNIPIVFLRKLVPPEYTENDGNRQKEYNELLALLSYSDLCPFANLAESIRLEDDNTLKVSTKNTFSATVKFKKLYISDGHNITGLSQDTYNTNDINLVLDYINIHGRTSYEGAPLTSEEDFVKRIHFYVSRRCAFYDKTKRDCVVASLIKQSDLDSQEYSENMARLYTSSIFRKNGIAIKTKIKREMELSSNVRKVFPLWKVIYQDLPSNFIMLKDIQPVKFDLGNTLYGKSKIYQRR